MDAVSELHLYAATSNRGKLDEFREAARASGITVLGVPNFDQLPGVEEDGETFEQNARKKAIHYSRTAGGLVFADDSGLEVAALNGAPGVRSARYAGSDANDRRNNEKLMRELAAGGTTDRRARFVCMIALARGGEVIATFEGYAEGVVAEAPRGERGFGYDPLFFVPSLGRTFGELQPLEKLRHSHRGQAFRAMLAWLQRRESERVTG